MTSAHNQLLEPLESRKPTICSGQPAAPNWVCGIKAIRRHLHVMCMSHMGFTTLKLQLNKKKHSISLFLMIALFLFIFSDCAIFIF